MRAICDRSVPLGRRPVSYSEHLLGALVIVFFEADVSGDRAEGLKHRGSEVRRSSAKSPRRAARVRVRARRML